MITNPSERLTEDRKFSASPDMSFIPPPGVPPPVRRPDGFEIRRKKRFDLSNQGICNPLIHNI